VGFGCGGLILCGLRGVWAWLGGVMVGIWVKMGQIWGSENGSKMGIWAGVGAFSENGGFSGFWGYKSSSVFGVKLGDLG